MRFLVDAQLPPALAVWLREQGHEAEHVFDVGLASASDHALWTRAKITGAAILTKDEDFVGLEPADQAAPAVVWLRWGNTATQVLIARLEPVLPAIVEALGAGEMLVEVS